MVAKTGHPIVYGPGIRRVPKLIRLDARANEGNERAAKSESK